MPGFLLPAALGLLSAGGTWLTNRANRQNAREQMEFQERMSSTAAQRGVQDYQRAGLNPALAYDRGASSPGGASAMMGDPITAAVSSASAAARLRQDMRIAKEQHDETMRLTRSQAENIRIDSAKKVLEQEAIRAGTRETDQRINFQNALQPFMVQAAAADALLKHYQVPGAKNTADFENLLSKGVDKDGIMTGKTAVQLLKLIRGR